MANDGASTTAGAELEQYSCDECRRRKLRCTREMPKCNQCVLAGRQCEYSRHGVLPRRVRKRKSFEDAEEEAPLLDARLSRIESTLTALTQAVEGLTQSLGESRSRVRSGHAGDDRRLQPAYRPSKSIDFPSLGLRLESGPDMRASTTECIDPQEISAELTGSAYKGMAELTQAFSAMAFDDDIRTKVKEARRANEPFFVPTSAEGAQYVEVFKDTWNVVRGIFESPPDDFWQEVLFQPSKVEERGWVIVFNCVMSTYYSFKESFDLTRSRQFRWNAWLALGDSSLLFEPSMAKLQAFALLATHCHDFITPNFSWTFLSHACRMFQALGLPKPSAINDEPYGKQSQKLLLFYAIHAVDMNLALTLGRPPLWNEDITADVPFPSPRQLAVFDPRTSYQQARDPSLQIPPDDLSYEDLEYGAMFLHQSLKLSRLIGRLLSSSSITSSRNHRDSTEFRRDLDAWLHESMSGLSAHIQKDRHLKSTQELDEMELGVSFLRFQYHHLVVICTRDNKLARSDCIESARGALSILKHLVSSSSQVYNGIVWQLLYEPFTHFFILFGQILSEPRSPTCPNDMEHLREAVTFFYAMKDNHQSAAKLGNIAETFLRLAQDYVQKKTKPKLKSKHRASGGSTRSQMTPQQRLPQDSLLPPLSSSDPVRSMSMHELNQQTSDSGSLSNSHGTPESHAEAPPVLLDFYNSVLAPQFTFDPPTDRPDSIADTTQANAFADADTVMQSLGNEALNNPLPFSFDWVPWGI